MPDGEMEQMSLFKSKQSQLFSEVYMIEVKLCNNIERTRNSLEQVLHFWFSKSELLPKIRSSVMKTKTLEECSELE